MAGSQFSPLTPRGRELLELQQVERIRARLERELKQATDREKEIKSRTARLNTLEADKAALEGLDKSAMSDQMKVLKASVMSLHAHVDSRLDFMQNSFDQILDLLQRPGLRPAAQSSLPLTAMSGPFPVQAGTQPSGTSATVAHTVASSSSGPAVIATQSPQQTVPPQGQQQGPWYPKTPMKPPLAFSDEKKDEELNTWLRTISMWVRAKRTLQEEEVITVASYLEGKAAKWLDGIVAKAGFRRCMADWGKTLTLEEFLDMVEARWHNPQQTQIATDAMLRLDQRRYRSVRELTSTVENLIVVPSLRYDDQVLLTMFLRCLPENLRTLLASEARLEKKSPQEWKKKGSRLMMVESDGTQTEIDELTDLMDSPEYDSEEVAEGSTLAAVVKTKAGGRVLAQQDGKKLRPIEYMSKKMPSKKLAKSTYERELYALYKALVHWRHFLLGRFFYLRTGHQTLNWIKTQPTLSDALKRWIEVIDQYDFKLEYRKGKYNKIADALSRRADYLGALVSEFGVCQRDKPRTQAPLGLLKPLPIPASPGQSVFMDFMDTLVTSRSGKWHIFVIIDRFTKYVRLIAMPETARNEHVIKLFVDNWVRDFGLPKSIISDRDVRFTSELWKKTAEQMGSQLQMTSGNHPEANGQAEQMNRVVQHLLRHYIKPNQDDWDEKLPLIASLYNNVVHSTTDFSPNQLHLG
ncbi:hypothetical protein CBR_g34130 [Chara braunii]|uniref:Integrase catalytic domain-containing protein n=1 Tax=Chara braunii TaxID=69332 RepID=A0A388LI49_CHABU|nr:hypothetical protein CBR_g34130 [Chara braunii]|eukprot:GBG81947.1 hypothetical protein CBR_g34130 [Chara braunii]